MKQQLKITILGGIIALTSIVSHADMMANDTTSKLLCETLLKTELKLAEGNEVIIDHVSLPPNTTLPKHKHPGETFIYLMEGSFTLWREGEPEITVREGETTHVPLDKIHSAKTTDQSAVAIVFRVHKEGHPIRVNIE